MGDSMLMRRGGGGKYKGFSIKRIADESGSGANNSNRWCRYTGLDFVNNDYIFQAAMRETSGGYTNTYGFYFVYKDGECIEEQIPNNTGTDLVSVSVDIDAGTIYYMQPFSTTTALSPALITLIK